MRVAALAGGVGGAKLVDGLANVLSNDQLTVIVNTGDDFIHWGLHISPDLDTICYTLAGVASKETGWGLAGDHFSALEMVKRLGGETWFKIGDLDLGTNLERTRRLKLGESLSEITRNFCHCWNIATKVIPMTDDPVATMVQTRDYGVIPFQEYFVKKQFEPEINGIMFSGIEKAVPAPGVSEAIEAADLVILCPSNPWVSIDPILSVGNVREILRHHPNVVAVSPIISGKALKGPAAKMFAELGVTPSAYQVARHYQNILNYFVLDIQDQSEENQISKLGIIPLTSNTIMLNSDDRIRLANNIINYFENIILGVA